MRGPGIVTGPMQQPVPEYWPLFQAYHRVREPLYRTIIQDADLGTGGWVLDAGCGDAFYSRLLSNVLGPRQRIVAIDLNPALLTSLRMEGDRVLRCLTDLERPGLRPGSFCAVWLARAMYSARDPVARLAALLPLLRPGGKLVVIENDLPHTPILSWPAEFERRILDARYKFLQSHSTQGWSPDRFRAASHLPAWLEAVGLGDVSMRTYVSEDVAPLSPELEHYWQLAMEWDGRLIRAFLSPDDWRTYRQAFDPASPDYVLQRPGFHLLELTAVAVGVKDRDPKARGA